MASSKLPPEPPSSELTPQDTYLRRRELLTNAGLFLGTTAAISAGLYLAAGTPRGGPKRAAIRGSDRDGGVESGALAVAKSSSFVGDEARTPFDDVSTYNNFYEFGTSKEEPARNAHTLRPRPWSVLFDGEVSKSVTVDLDTLMSWAPLEERIYRFRCVEAWSMVIPWVGLPLAEILKRVEPTSKAKYVAFTTLMDPQQMPGQRERVLDWPYVEGLRLDEAMHPLTLLAVGLYGKVLPNQNGAPLRLVVPWKYGFKNAKSIVKVTLTEQQPRTTWNLAGPDEYGFYANVNPAVPHPRWSQASERRIGELLRRPTLPFNGYAEQVASLYAGLDPKTLY